MDTSLDLTAAPREVLLAIIAQRQAAILELQATVTTQQAVIVQLQRRIETLEGKAKPGGPRGMPGVKPQSGQRPPREKQNRNPRPHGFARQRMTPAQRVEHVLEECPGCGTGLSGGWTQRTREVIDLPLVPVQVTEHVYVARTCPLCQRRLFNVNYFCRLASIILAGSPPYPAPAAGPLRSGSWGRRIPG